MARPPSPAIAARNHEINSLFQQGHSINELAGQFSLTPQRIGQVIATQNPEEGEDYDRALYRGYLWRLFEEIRELYRNPGHKMAPNGAPARDLDGEPALDTNVRLQAGELELKILESLRKMDARDRPQQKHVQYTMEIASSAAAADIARRAAERDRQIAEDERRRRELEELERRVIPGQVVREIPPS